MKKLSYNKICLFLIICTAVSVLTGCSKSEEHISSDGKLSLKASSSYVVTEKQLNENSVLELANDKKERYVIVFSYDSAGFSATEEFNSYYLDSLSYNYELTEISAVEAPSFELQENARLTKAKLTKDSDSLYALICVIPHEESYYTVICYTPYKNIDKAAKDFESVLSGVSLL